MSHNRTNAAILKGLSKAIAGAHVGNTIVNFEQAGWRHDVLAVIDLFIEKDLRGQDIASCLPAETKFGNGGPLRTWPTFFTDAINLLPPGSGYCARQRKGNNSARVFVRCIKADQVPAFRAIVAEKLGL